MRAHASSRALRARTSHPAARAHLPARLHPCAPILVVGQGRRAHSWCLLRGRAAGGARRWRAEAARGGGTRQAARGSCHPTGAGGHSCDSSDDNLERQADHEEDEDERRRATRKMDTTAAAATTTVTMGVMTADSMEAYSMAYSMTTAVATTVAMVAATRDSACNAKHRSVRELRPLRAGQTSRWQAGPGALSPTIRRGSVMLVKLVVRRDVDDRARAQLADVVEVAVPVGGHADGGQARALGVR